MLLVQAEAQYNSDTINNISTVGVVKWGSSIFVLRCRKPWRASVTSEFSAARVPSDVEDVLPGINFLTNPVSLRSWRCGRLRKRKIRNYFLHVWFFKSILRTNRCFQKNTEYFWSHRSRKEGLDNAGWSGRSYIVLLVVLVLNVDDGQMNGFSMLATMFQDWMFQTVILSSRDYILLFDRMIQKTFFFLSSPMKPKRSSTILLFLSFSRESSMSECVRKM